MNLISRWNPAGVLTIHLLVVLLLPDAAHGAVGRHVSAITSADGRISVALLADMDQIRLFRGQGNDWKAEQIRLDTACLIPDAPLVLLNGPADVNPAGQSGAFRIVTVTTSGTFSLITVTQPTPETYDIQITPFGEAFAPFPPLAGFSCQEHNGRLLIFAVNQAGELCEIPVVGSDSQTAESTGQPLGVPITAGSDFALPGSMVSTLEGNSDEVFLVDRRGNLVSWVRDPIRRWKGPQLIGMGFLPGSDVMLWRRPDGAQELFAAAVNSLGELRLARREAAVWKTDIAPGWLLPAGTPVSVHHTPGNIRMFGVTGEGILQEMHLLNTEWRQRFAASGLRVRFAVVIPSSSLQLISTDAAGDLIVGVNSDDNWTSWLSPFDNSEQRGQIVRREWSSETPLSKEFRLSNPSDRDVLIRVRDLNHPLSKIDYSLPSRQELILTVQYEAQRTLTSYLKKTVGVGEAAETAEVIRTGSVAPADSLEVEVLENGSQLPYFDLRAHRYPLCRASDSAELTIGRFSLPGQLTAESEEDPLNKESSAEQAVDVNIIESAVMQSIRLLKQTSK